MSKQKLIDQIKINPEYETLVSPLSQEDFDALKQSIKHDGQWLPIILNQNYVLLDGHHRFKICKQLGIEPRTTTRVFHNDVDEYIFVGECNLARRNLKPLERIQLLLKLEPKYRERAKLSQGKRNDLTSAKHFAEVGKVTKKLGQRAGVSDRTFEKGKKILQTANLDLIAAVHNGNKTINGAYKEIQKAEKKKQFQEAIKQTQINLPETVQLHNQKFQDLKLKPNSVSLIFTDPPYEEKSLYLYKDLAKQAAKVLRDGGSLMCYAGHFCIDRVIESMKDEGLKYHWIIAVVHSGPSASVFGRKILVGYKPLLWFTKGKYEGEFVKDLIKSEFQGKELHEWAQSTVESDYYIKYLTLENDIVYDPFLGQGTFGISTVKLKRQFIGCEINKQHFENAQRMISIANKS